MPGKDCWREQQFSPAYTQVLCYAECAYREAHGHRFGLGPLAIPLVLLHCIV